eukprot:767790-Hanusia_phi.AAC.5
MQAVEVPCPPPPPVLGLTRLLALLQAWLVDQHHSLTDPQEDLLEGGGSQPVALEPQGRQVAIEATQEVGKGRGGGMPQIERSLAA